MLAIHRQRIARGGQACGCAVVRGEREQRWLRCNLGAAARVWPRDGKRRAVVSGRRQNESDAVVLEWRSTPGPLSCTAVSGLRPPGPGVVDDRVGGVPVWSARSVPEVRTMASALIAPIRSRRTAGPSGGDGDGPREVPPQAFTIRAAVLVHVRAGEEDTAREQWERAGCYFPAWTMRGRRTGRCSIGWRCVCREAAGAR